MESPSLEILKASLDVILCNLLYMILLWQGALLGGPSSLYDSVILHFSGNEAENSDWLGVFKN